MSTKLANILGYYYVVFQGQIGSYAKCWIDGEEDYTFMVKDEMLESTQKDLPNPDLLNKMDEALGDTYLHLWDVENDSITKLRPSQNKEMLRDKFSEMIKPTQKSFIETSQIGWDTNLDDFCKKF